MFTISYMDKPKGKINLRVKDVGDFIQVELEDNGKGIAAKDLPYIFDRFYKADSSRGLDKTGTGLGLYIAKTKIEAHGEKIGVESEYEKYCRFYFTLSNNEKTIQKLLSDK